MSSDLDKVYRKYLENARSMYNKTNYKPKITFFTGSGISVDSGLSTYRMEDGLWSNYKIEEVATSNAIKKDINFVNSFFNDRRKEVANAQPNIAHKFIRELEKDFDVYVVTQNIDDLHEKAQSSNVIHLHGEIMKSRSKATSRFLYEQIDDIKPTDRCIKTDSPLRPHVVLFGENVINYNVSRKHLRESDIVVIIGTSLTVNPAAGLITELLYNKKIYILDPNLESFNINNCHLISKTASSGIEDLGIYLSNDLINIRKKFS